MRTVLGIFQILVLMCMPLTGMAQLDGSGDSADLEELMQRIDRGMTDIESLDVQLAGVPEMDREALMYRRDERGLSLLKELDQVARGAAKLPEEDPVRQELTRRLREDSGGVADWIFKWTGELNRRIGQFSSELESADGTSRVALEAYIYSLEDLRIQSYQAVGNVIEGRKTLGLPVSGILPTLQERLYLYAETLAGRLEFSAAAVVGLQAKLGADPQNAELVAAEKSFASNHAQDLRRLKAISELLGSLDLDNAAYKELLFQQGQELSVRDIDSDLIEKHLREGWTDLQTTLADRAPDMVFRLLILFIVLWVFRALSRVTRRAVVAACKRPGVNMSTLLEKMLVSVSGAAVMAIGIMVAISQLGISLGPMLAGLGVAGFIVGFALQDTLGNFAAGGMILFYRPYDVDDVVEVAGASGLVKKMNLVSTTITTFDNQTLVVPNSKIWGDVIKNVTAQNTRRVDLTFGIGYGDDMEKAENVLRDIISGHELVLSSPEPIIKLHTLGDSSVNFVVRPWVNTSDYWSVYWDVTREVKVRFDREGISIPFPQRDVHIYQQSV